MDVMCIARAKKEADTEWPLTRGSPSAWLLFIRPRSPRRAMANKCSGT